VFRRHHHFLQELCSDGRGHANRNGW
jgi:hypothetical protein